MSEFASANLTAGQLNAIVKKLGGYEGAIRFLQGKISIVELKHTINCDLIPFIPYDWSIKTHKMGGQFIFDPAKVVFYQSEKQKEGDRSILGNDLWQEIKGKPVLNACVLDYLLDHQELIPNGWKLKWTFFWGTIYSTENILCVRFIAWDERKSEWGWGWMRLDSFFNSNKYAILANNA